MAAVDSAATPAAGGGEHERRLALGTLAQQASQVVATLVMLAVVTAVARSRTLAEFGLYGLLVSLTTYLLIAQASVEGAAVKALGEALDRRARNRAFSTALTLYTVAGVAAGAIVAGGGIALLGVLNVPPSLHPQATLAVIALGAVMALGWPLKTFQDVLRGSQHFTAAAFAEIAGYVVFGAASAALLATGAPLWALIAVGGALGPLVGLASLAIGRARNLLAVSFAPGLVERGSTRSFLGLSWYLLLLGVADLVIYALDRAVLSAFRSPSAVGLYEGPLRAHNLVRQLNATLSLTVLPAASRYLGQGDDWRVRDLLLRGTRYVVAAVVPVTIVLMALSKPILHVWLGARFDSAAPAMAILMSYWLVASSASVASPMLVAAGRARALVWYAWAMALLNLALSLALTPSLGIDGVVLGTAIPYVLLAPVVLLLACGRFRVTLADFAREAWLPAFSLALPLAGALAAVRLAGAPTSLIGILVTVALALGGYWLAYYRVWLRPSERALVRGLVRRRA